VDKPTETLPQGPSGVPELPAAAGVLIDFEGWFQCRMATDPDPPDELRGISGASIAAAGEPDFDRVVRFQPPTDNTMVRRRGPQIGVSVTGVTVGGKASVNDPLMSARVDLLSGPRFWEQNGVIARRNTAFIDPFDLEITGPTGAGLRRRAFWDPQRPNVGFYDVDETFLKHREVSSFDFDQPEVLSKALQAPVSAETGKEELNKLKDGFIRSRLSQLRDDLAGERDPIARVALEQRIQVLERSDWQGLKIRLLAAARVNYQFVLNGVPTVMGLSDVDTVTPWPIKFWMGAWDNDALCGFVRGTLSVPGAVPIIASV
jgi:hypothetical protein